MGILAPVSEASGGGVGGSFGHVFSGTPSLAACDPPPASFHAMDDSRRYRLVGGYITPSLIKSGLEQHRKGDVSMEHAILSSYIVIHLMGCKDDRKVGAPSLVQK